MPVDPLFFIIVIGLLLFCMKVLSNASWQMGGSGIDQGNGAMFPTLIIFGAIMAVMLGGASGLAALASYLPYVVLGCIAIWFVAVWTGNR